MVRHALRTALAGLAASFALGAVAALAGPAQEAAVPMAAEQAYVNPAAKYLPPIKMDAYNPDVTDDMRANPKPKRGGRLVIRNPADLQHLNQITVTGQPERLMINQMSDSLVDQDPESLEYFAEMAWSWRETDLIKRKGGTVEEGRILDKSDTTISFVPGAWKQTFNRFDVAEYDTAQGFLVLSKDYGSARHEGRITPQGHTIVVEEGYTKTPETIALADLETYEFVIGTEREQRPFAKENCAFEFLIRDGVTWHDGKPFTAQDVKFSYDVIMNPGVDCQHKRNYYEDVSLCQVTEGGKSVKFHYAKPYFQALAFLGGAADSAYFMPRHVFEPEKFGGDDKAFADAFNNHPFRERPIYTGPYEFGSWKRNDRLILKRHENHWKNKLPQGAIPRWTVGQPWMDEIHTLLVATPEASLKELEKGGAAGGLDVDIDVEPATWVRADTNSPEFLKRVVRSEHVGFLYTYIGWNQEREMFQDPAVRRALGMLIPREEIAEKVHFGLAFPVSGPFYSQGPGYNHEVKPLEHDPRGARRLLARAGWLDRDGDGILENKDGVPLAFNYSIHNARDYHQKIADIIKENVEQAGIRMTIDKSDWTIFSDRVRDHNFDAVRFAWGTTVEPDPFQIWHSSQTANKGDNFVSYKNARVDEICVQIRETFDPETRWQMAQEMHKIVFEDQPYSFLFGFKETYFMNRNLRGIKLYANAYPQEYTEWYWAEGSGRH